MTFVAYFSPSMPEIMISLLVLNFSVGVPVGIGVLLWKLLKSGQPTANSRFRGDAIFSEAIVDNDGVLRISIPLSSRWAGRAVRVVIEPLDRL